MTDVTLSTLPGAIPTEQVAVVLTHADGQSRLSLRHQSWGGDSLGWYTQRTIDLDPQQVAQLRQALGVTGLPSRVAPRASVSSAMLRLVHPESA